MERKDSAVPRRVTGTREWAPVNANCSVGCSHDCKYCYAKSMAIRFGRATPETWRIEAPYLHRAAELARKRPTRIMFPTTHDITPAIMDTAMAALTLMLDAGHEMLVVSKPHPECIEGICRDLGRYRNRILFRFTIGSASGGVLRFWEPGAPGFAPRMAALEAAFRAGFRTSVSCEPMLDGRPQALVEAVAPFVTDSVWLGKINMLRQRLKVNRACDPETLARADELTALQADEPIRALYEVLKSDPKVKWKDSIKQVVGLAQPTEAGLDI